MEPHETNDETVGGHPNRCFSVFSLGSFSHKLAQHQKSSLQTQTEEMTKALLFLLPFLFGSTKGDDVHFWLEPNLPGFEDPSCGNIRGAYSVVVDQCAQATLSAELYNHVAGMTAFHNEAFEVQTRRNLRERQLVDCSICESNPPASIEACCIQIPYQHCGVCVGGGGGRRRELLEANLLLVTELPNLNTAIKAALDQKCNQELTQLGVGANCWSCDPTTKSWDGKVFSVSLQDGY